MYHWSLYKIPALQSVMLGGMHGHSSNHLTSLHELLLSLVHYHFPVSVVNEMEFGPCSQAHLTKSPESSVTFLMYALFLHVWFRAPALSWDEIELS